MWVVILWHGNDCFPVKCSRSRLVHCMSGDGWGSRAGPVQGIPSPVIGKSFNRTHIWGGKEKNKCTLLSTKDIVSGQKRHFRYIHISIRYFSNHFFPNSPEWKHNNLMPTNDSWLHTAKLSYELVYLSQEQFLQNHVIKVFSPPPQEKNLN